MNNTQVPVYEPTVEEQIKQATEALEQKNNDLIHQIYNKEQQIEQLRKTLEQQAVYFDRTVSRLVQIFCGPKEF